MRYKDISERQLTNAILNYTKYKYFTKQE